jgi:VanZ family protein
MSGRVVLRVCNIAALALIIYAALGPANWQLRPMLGWKTEHFLGFLAMTLLTCVAWPRPLIVGLALMVMAGVLEALQGLTPDRVPDFPTALSGAGGALIASIATEVFGRVRRKSNLQARTPAKSN